MRQNACPTGVNPKDMGRRKVQEQAYLNNGGSGMAKVQIPCNLPNYSRKLDDAYRRDFGQRTSQRLRRLARLSDVRNVEYRLRRYISVQRCKLEDYEKVGSCLPRSF